MHPSAAQDNKKRKAATVKPGRAQPKFTPEQDSAADKFCNYIKSTPAEQIVSDFEKVQTYPEKKGDCEVCKKNTAKNRYGDVHCLDATRVELKTDFGNYTSADGDYIHANWISFDYLERKYIATQGPKDNTIEDFWRMVFQENVAAIVCVCNFVEGGQSKCAEYFPINAGEYKNYGKMFVNNKKVDDIVYTLEVLPDGCSNSIVTKLIFCTEWPDKGMPTKGGIPLKIRRLTREAGTGPVVVHCSAGIGRTGTYILIEMAIQKLLKGKEPVMIDLYKDLRDCRASSVQNTQQYLYAYSSVLDFIITRRIEYKPLKTKFLKGLCEIMEEAAAADPRPN
ncbi:unnamed protein product, partial [Mesorhabditis spiculigera]